MDIDNQTQQLISLIVRLLEVENMYTGEVVDYLVERGLDKDMATKLVDQVSEHLEERRSKNAGWKVAIGAIIAIAGIVLTVVIFSAGWIVSITIAMVIFGGTLFVDGIKNLNI